MFDAMVFAGGGNRCYWQGGFYEVLAGHGLKVPALVAGASAGAFAAAYSLLGIGPQVRDSAVDLTLVSAFQQILRTSVRSKTALES